MNRQTNQQTHQLEETLEEQRRLEELIRIELDDLREILEEPPSVQHSEWIPPILDRVLQHLDAQFQMEEREGYLEDVLERYPNWHLQIAHFRQEHELLRRQLHEVRERVADEAGRNTRSSELSKECRRQISGWIEAYQSHQRRENRLILDAFTLDVGEGE